MSSPPLAVRPAGVRPAGIRPAGPPAAAPKASPRWGLVYHVALGVTWVAIAGFFLFWGLDYYVTPMHERPYAPGHDLFSPTGIVGNRLAILGTAMLTLGVGGYMLRKRWSRLHGIGKLRNWLSAHIWLCTLGPFLILLHTSFKVGGLVSIAFWSMVLVVASGVVGRYVYVRLPQNIHGRTRSMNELEEEQRALVAEIDAASPGLAAGELAPFFQSPPVPRGVFAALGHALKSDVGAWRQRRALHTALAAAGVAPEQRTRLEELARRHRRLAQERALLAPFERLFRYWHTFHLPFAITMGLILLVHIAVAIAFGYAWTPG